MTPAGTHAAPPTAHHTPRHPPPTAPPPRHLPRSPFHVHQVLGLGADGKAVQPVITLRTTPPWRHSACSPEEVRRSVAPIAERLAHCFGFQVEATQAGEIVPSSLTNQIDHVTALISSTLGRCPHDDDDGSLQLRSFQWAVADLHSRIFGNYLRWVAHVRLRAERAGGSHRTVSVGTLGCTSWDGTNIDSFDTAEEETTWQCHAQLHQLVLWCLIWGEVRSRRRHSTTTTTSPPPSPPPPPPPPPPHSHPSPLPSSGRQHAPPPRVPLLRVPLRRQLRASPSDLARRRPLALARGAFFDTLTTP